MHGMSWLGLCWSGAAGLAGGAACTCSKLLPWPTPPCRWVIEIRASPLLHLHPAAEHLDGQDRTGQPRNTKMEIITCSCPESSFMLRGLWLGDGFVFGATHLLPANGMVRVPEAVQIKVEVVAHGMS